MVKRKTTRRKAPKKAVRRAGATYTPRRRTAKTGYDKIPSAMATVALVAVNKDNIRGIANAVSNNGSAKLTEYPSRIIGSKWVMDQAKNFVKGDALVKDAVAMAGGYVAGDLFRKFAPTVLKKPVAKISKKIPKVI